MIAVTLLVILAIVLLGVIAVRTVSNLIDNVQEIRSVDKPLCKVHKWAYNANEELQCSVCDRTSRQINVEQVMNEDFDE